MELNKDYNLQDSDYYSVLNNVVEEPHTLLEENEDTVLGNTRSTVYSAIWKEGPRVLWNQQNEKYERTETKVTIELYKDNNQIDKILNELKIYLDCHAQECALLFQFYGISKQPDSDDYFIVKQFTQNSSLANYISQNFNNLDWETKLHLLLYVAEDLKAIHNAGYIHRYLHPFSVLVFDNIGSSYDSSFSNSDDGCFCAIGEFSRCCKDLVLTNTEETIGWQHYMAPEYLRYKTYTKASDVYAFGMIMHTVVSLEFLAADNIGYYKTKSQEALSQKIELNKPKDLDLSDIINLEPSEMVNFIKKKNLVKFINKDELTTMKKIDSGHFGSISTAIWKKTDKLVVCKKNKK
ncbi:unnamed protein product [Rhizophagus irregularis]|nr:unnamed protein product [Rhizophagus irregularis]